MPQLTVVKLRSAKHPGGKVTRPIRLGDGAGLYLQLAVNDTKSWLLRFTRHGVAREMGLGAADPDGRAGLSLSEARQQAAEAKRLLQAGMDPITERDKGRLEKRLAEERGKEHTFRLAAEGYIATHSPAWKSAKHTEQWQSTLEAYVYPAIGGMDVAQIGVSDVLGVLKPIWQKIPETASRVRQRIEKALDHAGAPSRRWRSSENPARWRGVLEHELPPISKIKKVSHRPSLPLEQTKAFMETLGSHDGMSAMALRFMIFTGCRSGEGRGAVWGEIDLDTAVWTIPAKRMKGGVLHRIPLSKPALTVLRQVQSLSSGKHNALVFPSALSGKALSDMALSQLMRGMSFDGLEDGALPRWRDGENRAAVPHGFRATFKSWTRETGYPDHLSEIALAHKDKDKVRAAYAREDLLEQRRPMMEAWAKVCSAPAGSVTNIKDAKRR